ncbi:MAG: ABC transporter permease subunit [Planktotalea sp.]|jgi:glycine betaine/proline transport system permease protein|uniref:ABC transporter permease n=1 Tax=Planktotalea sp. TaxID=2029877 RepID=UPI000183BF87|nr:ABC transporter permease subunit [Planktotalea sp.]EDZ41370.1 glycine betaine/proline ABC transporter, permease protein [Rhodobacteraceae bacterium HTCC2083]MBT5821050.1 ABC transporter permease subunit [Paracoccaceae bacterium]MDG1077714.1 ABC transporter permease subunit [Planktotalea sp.]MDG1084075.1 ABC transporter permease subunit [Planktotalea sp.]HCW85444.1 glycine/betaine ABC transporter permease [Paracoccaceae bacterium]
MADTTAISANPPMSRSRLASLLVGLAILVTALQYLGFLPAALHRLPEALVPDFARYLDAFFNFVKDDLGLFALTRWLTGLLQTVLDTTANLLFGKRRWPNLGPIPWTAIAASMAVLGYYLGGWKMAALVAVTFCWTALVGQWKIAMQTMSVLVVAAPTAFIIGLSLGVAAWKSPAFNRALKPVLSVLQTLPFFTYLLPAVIFFKVGPTAGAVATTIYAIPPMILMTTLGLQKVSPEVVEAGHMSGCTKLQLLRHVYLPSARTEILVGVNQVIMLCLAMVVLTAFIGMPGLGAKLLAMMGSFKLGRSFEIGVTIVLLAVTLDRMSKAWVVKQPEHFERGTPWWKRHIALLLGLGAFVVFCIVAQFIEVASEIGRKQSLSVGKELDTGIKWFLNIEWVKATTGFLRAFVNVQILIPFRNFMLSIPTPAFILLITAFALWLGGRRQAITALIFFSLVALSGWWDRSVITLYSVISAVSIAMLLGLPIAILAARTEKWSQRLLLVCDTAQTFPSFVYLIPAIMLFGITDIAVIFSILIFAMVPLIRYTIEGLRTVPPEVIEAAEMSGATRMQKLVNVELPLALPTMAVGFNQAIMFAFFMVIIAAFIGTQDLGQELQRTLAGTDLGKNFVLGICVSLMALTFDLTILKWSSDRKKMLGLEE